MRQRDVFAEQQLPTQRQLIWWQLKRSPITIIALWFLLLLVVLVLFGPWFSPWDPYLRHPNALLHPPLWAPEGSLRFPFGTDDLGRDIFSRLLHGARYTLGNAAYLVAITLLIGGAIGTLAALSRGMRASILSHLLDAILAIPSLLLALIIVALFGPGLDNTLWAIGLVLIPQFIHATYSNVREELSKEYVNAARLDGAKQHQILLREILPNISSSLVHRITLALSSATLDIAALGFLGLGAQPPQPEWGSMLSSASVLFFLAPWTMTLPGMALMLSMLSIHITGDALSQALKLGSEY